MCLDRAADRNALAMRTFLLVSSVVGVPISLLSSNPAFTASSHSPCHDGRVDRYSDANSSPRRIRASKVKTAHPTVQPVAETVPNTQPAFARPSGELRLGRRAPLASAGYRIWTQVIPGESTPKNRLLIGAFDDGSVGS
jgi:hypothetical protein